MTTVSSATSRSREAQAYLDGVGASLADLPVDDRADLLDELATHLDELATEGDAPLVSRLGSPQDYAAELRASAGLPPARSRGRGRSELLAGLRGDVERARKNALVAATLDFLTVLRPVWWVLRAWIVVVVLARLSRPQRAEDWSSDLILVPAGMVSFWLLLAAVVASVQIGRRGAHLGRRAGAIVAVINLFAALAFLPVLESLADASARYGSLEYLAAVPYHGVYSAGEQVTNVYAYDAAGQRLSDIRLYDQDGDPLLLEMGDPAAGQPSVQPLPGVPTPGPTTTPSPTPSPTGTTR